MCDRYLLVHDPVRATSGTGGIMGGPEVPFGVDPPVEPRHVVVLVDLWGDEGEHLKRQEIGEEYEFTIVRGRMKMRIQLSDPAAKKAWVEAVKDRIAAKRDKEARRQSQIFLASVLDFRKNKANVAMKYRKPKTHFDVAIQQWPERRPSYAVLDDGSRMLRTMAFKNQVREWRRQLDEWQRQLNTSLGAVMRRLSMKDPRLPLRVSVL